MSHKLYRLMTTFYNRGAGRSIFSNSGIRSRTRRVKNWQDHGMVVRWVATSLLDMEQRFKRIMGYQQLWILEAKLKELSEEERIDGKSKVA